MQKYRVEAVLYVQAGSTGEVYDALNEILRPHLPAYNPETVLQDYVIGPATFVSVAEARDELFADAEANADPDAAV